MVNRSKSLVCMRRRSVLIGLRRDDGTSRAEAGGSGLHMSFEWGLGYEHSWGGVLAQLYQQLDQQTQNSFIYLLVAPQS